MKILLVDDEYELLKLLAEIISNEGHDVVTAVNGKIALELFSNTKPGFDAVLTDIKMPEMDGLSLLKQIRNMDPEIPVVIMTGHGDLDLSIQALRLSAFDYMLKPLNLASLQQVLEKIAAVCQRYQELPALLPFMESSNTLTLPCQTRWISVAVSHFQQIYAPLCRMANDGFQEITTSLYELLSNAFIHGSLEVDSRLKEESWDKFENMVRLREADPVFGTRKVHAHCHVAPEGISTEDPTHVIVGVTFDVEDEGKGFDTTKRLKTRDPMDLLTASGRGIMMIQMFMDEVSWNEKGNRMHLKKRLRIPRGE
ncbi:MAG: response regulator [SAR324 cluster bacterium]|nr:response regulator [SAR324 cluster bacterium]